MTTPQMQGYMTEACATVASLRLHLSTQSAPLTVIDKVVHAHELLLEASREVREGSPA